MCSPDDRYGTWTRNRQACPDSGVRYPGLVSACWDWQQTPGKSNDIT